MPNFGKDIFPKLNLNDIKSLPIPKEFEKFEEIEKRVCNIFSNKSDGINADTNDLETQIDQLVYELYGLTEEEIKIVEGN